MDLRTSAAKDVNSGRPAAVDRSREIRLPNLNLAIANCARLLLDRVPDDHALEQALADLVQALGSPHAVLFQIKSYHAEDYRGQWLACSAADPCSVCQDIRDWDFLRLLDDEKRRLLEDRRSCRLNIRELLPDFQQVLTARGAVHLVMIPITVTNKWWGGLCIEGMPGAMQGSWDQNSGLETLAALFSLYHERCLILMDCQERDQLTGALEMAGTVCHKLNQPMQVILGYASMVTSGDIRDPEQVKEIVQLIEDETRRMGIMTKNLMGITKNRSAD